MTTEFWTDPIAFWADVCARRRAAEPGAIIAFECEYEDEERVMRAGDIACRRHGVDPKTIQIVRPGHTFIEDAVKKSNGASILLVTGKEIPPRYGEPGRALEALFEEHAAHTDAEFIVVVTAEGVEDGEIFSVLSHHGISSFDIVREAVEPFAPLQTRFEWRSVNGSASGRVH